MLKIESHDGSALFPLVFLRFFGAFSDSGKVFPFAFDPVGRGNGIFLVWLFVFTMRAARF